MAGNYITWFKEEGSKERILLYKLENEGIVRCNREILKKGWSKHEWVLTKKGQKIVDKSKILQEIWGEGKKINVIEFYNEIIKLIKS